MKYALKLADDGRILSATFEEFATDTDILVDSLPDGDITNYRYEHSEYVNDPSPSLHKEAIERRIDELKRNLFDTDYNILKVVEGAATLSEMSEVVAKRASWRKEINDLEKELG